MDAESLKKLTVAQLKVLCKEKLITGYSKLQKNVIIDKLLSTRPQESQQQQTVHRQDVATNTRLSQETSTPLAPRSTLAGIHPPELPCATQILAAMPVSVLRHDASTSSSFQIRNTSDKKHHLVRCDGTSSNPHPLPAKRQKTANENGSNSSRVSNSNLSISNIMSQSSGGARQPDSEQDLPTGISKPHAAGQQVAPSSIPVGSNRLHSSKSVREQLKVSYGGPKRFTRLVPTADTRIGHPEQRTTANAPSGAQTPDRPYLDLLRSYQTPSLQLIGLPPSLSQRRLVLAFSVAFSLMSTEELRTLSLVSRLMRYAAYHSVLWRLRRTCPGDRLTEILRRHSANTTNFWPYFRFRQAEQRNLSEAINASILGSHPCKNRVSDRLLWNPDNRKQATVAARFLLTHLFFEVSVGISDGDSFVVTDAQEVVPREIWTVTTRTQDHEDVFYVLEATCEAIGQATSSVKTASVERGPTQQPRTDWSTYIQEYISSLSTGQPNRPLMAQLKWTNHEEYFQGISKLWLRRTKQEGDLGAAKVFVAERYVLACVVGNSISGRWMSSTAMDQEFNGLPARIDLSKLPVRKIHLFLPAHHHIESLHFSTPRGQRLHPAVAIVQTPGRVYYILRDNGMQIGCEEDGVAHVWRDLLKCTDVGTAE